jgi:hypothetical protein
MSKQRQHRLMRTVASVAFLTGGAAGAAIDHEVDSHKSSASTYQEMARVTLGSSLDSNNFAAAGVVEQGMRTPNADATGISDEIGLSEYNRYYKGQVDTSVAPIDYAAGNNFCWRGSHYLSTKSARRYNLHQSIYTSG